MTDRRQNYPTPPPGYMEVKHLRRLLLAIMVPWSCTSRPSGPCTCWSSVCLRAWARVEEEDGKEERFCVVTPRVLWVLHQATCHLPDTSHSFCLSNRLATRLSVSLSVSQSPSCCCGEEDKHEEAADPLFISSGLARCRHTQFTHDTRREQRAGRLPTFVVMEGAVCAHSRHVAVPVNHSQQTLFVSRVAKQRTSGASLVRSNCLQVQLAQLSLLPPELREDQSSACTARPC